MRSISIRIASPLGPSIRPASPVNVGTVVVLAVAVVVLASVMLFPCPVENVEMVLFGRGVTTASVVMTLSSIDCTDDDVGTGGTSTAAVRDGGDVADAGVGVATI